jgi:hypothetical protein
MSARRILRIVLSLVILIILWIRVAQEWHGRSGSWLAGAITLSAILLMVVIADLTGSRRAGRSERDAVPKRPLGLE